MQNGFETEDDGGGLSAIERRMRETTESGGSSPRSESRSSIETYIGTTATKSKRVIRKPARFQVEVKSQPKKKTIPLKRMHDEYGIEGQSSSRITTSEDPDYILPIHAKVVGRPRKHSAYSSASSIAIGSGFSQTSNVARPVTPTNRPIQLSTLIGLAPSSSQLPSEAERTIMSRLDEVPEFSVSSAGFMHFIRGISDQKMVEITKSLANLQVPPGKSEVHEVAQVVRHLWSSLPFEMRLEFEDEARKAFLSDERIQENQEEEKSNECNSEVLDSFDRDFLRECSGIDEISDAEMQQLMQKLAKKPCMPRSDCGFMAADKLAARRKQAVAGTQYSTSQAIELNCCDEKVTVSTTNEVIDHYTSRHYVAIFYACHFCRQTFPSIDSLRVHDYKPCKRFAEYSMSRLLSTKEKKLNIKMNMAFFYLACTGCGLWIAVRSRCSNIVMREKAWSFFKCACENHSVSYLVPIMIYCMEQPVIESDAECKWIFEYISRPKSLKVACSQCGIESFNSIEEIETHFMATPHENEIRQCGKCSAKFGTEAMLLHHMKSHFNEAAELATFLTEYARYYPPSDSSAPPVVGWKPKSYASGGLNHPLSVSEETHRYVNHCMPLPKKKFALALKNDDYENVDKTDADHCFSKQSQIRFDLGYEEFDYASMEGDVKQKEVKSKLNVIFRKHMDELEIGLETEWTNPEQIQQMLGIQNVLSPSRVARPVFPKQFPRDPLTEDVAKTFLRKVHMPVHSCMDPIINSLLRRSYLYCSECKCIFAGSSAKRHFIDDEFKEHKTRYIYSVAQGTGGLVSCVNEYCEEQFCSIFGLRKHIALAHALYVDFRYSKKDLLSCSDKDSSLNRLVDMNRVDAGRSYNALLLDAALDMPSGFLKQKQQFTVGRVLSTPTPARAPITKPLLPNTAAITSGSGYSGISTTVYGSKRVPLFRQVQVRRGKWVRMCEHCDFSANFREEMATHIREQHIVVCSDCGEAFLAKTNEANHAALCTKRINGSLSTSYATCGVCTHRTQISRIYNHLLESHLEVLYFFSETGRLEPTIWNVSINVVNPPRTSAGVGIQRQMPMNANWPVGRAFAAQSSASTASPVPADPALQDDSDDDDIIIEKMVTPADKTSSATKEIATELSARIRVEKDDDVMGGQNQPGFKDDDNDEIATTEERSNTPLIVNSIENDGDDEVQAIAIVKHHSGTTSSSLATSREKKEKCPRCSQAFMSAASLRNHIENDHKHDAGGTTDKVFGMPLDKVSYFCVNCCISFEDPKEYQRHKVAHGATYAHMCRYCSQFTFNPSHQEHHEKSHIENASKLTYGCGFCYKAFRQDSLLYWHLHREHKVQMYFFCKSCFLGSLDGVVIYNHISRSTSCWRLRSWPIINTVGICPARLINYQPANERVYMQDYVARENAGQVTRPSDCSHRSLITHLTDIELISCPACGSLRPMPGFIAANNLAAAPYLLHINAPDSVVMDLLMATKRSDTLLHYMQDAYMQNCYPNSRFRNPMNQVQRQTPRSNFNHHPYLAGHELPLRPGGISMNDSYPNASLANASGLSTTTPLNALLDQAARSIRSMPPITRQMPTSSSRIVPLDNGQPGQFVSMDTGEIITNQPTDSVNGVNISLANSNTQSNTRPVPINSANTRLFSRKRKCETNDDESDDVITVSDDETNKESSQKETQRRQQQQQTTRQHANSLGQPGDICKICGVAIARPNLHFLHDPSAPATNYLCLNCGSDITTEEQAMKHYCVKHFEQANKNSELCIEYDLRCPFCNEQQQTVGSLRSHINKAHVQEAPFASQWCNLRFVDEKRRNEHDEAHEQFEKDNKSEALCCGLCGSMEQWKVKVAGRPTEIRHIHTHALRSFSMCRICFFCFENDGNKTRFVEHFQTRHMQGDRCLFCKFSVNDVHSIKRHCINAFKSYDDTNKLVIKTTWETKNFFGVVSDPTPSTSTSSSSVPPPDPTTSN